jgi:hypothetical protein
MKAQRLESTGPNYGAFASISLDHTASRLAVLRVKP